MKKRNLNHADCNSSLTAVRDALYVLNGKWKLPLIVTLSGGAKRFKEIQRALIEITPKVLSKELRELELNDFVTRKVFDTVPVTVMYELTTYSETLDPIIDSLRDWGLNHRDHIVKERKQEAVTV